jgi:hypothetical protein
MFGLFPQPVVFALLPVIKIRLGSDQLGDSVQDSFVVQEEAIIDECKKNREDYGHQE